MWASVNSGVTIFAARNLDVSHDPLGFFRCMLKGSYDDTRFQEGLLEGRSQKSLQRVLRRILRRCLVVGCN